MDYTLEDYNNAVAVAKAIRDKDIVEVLALYDKAIALANAVYKEAWVQACNDVEGWHDYHHACALANADYKKADAEAELVFVMACARTRENFDEVAFHVRAKANAEAEAVRDSVIAEARARLSADYLKILIRQELAGYEILE